MKISKWKQHIILCIAVVGLFSKAIIIDVQAANTLRVAFERDNPYYAYVNDSGDIVGLQIDIMDALSDEMGVTSIEYFPVESIDECIEALQSGTVDAILGFPSFYDGDLPNILISTEITTIDLCMMATTENAEKIRRGELTSYNAVFEHNINNYMIVASMGAHVYYVAGSQEEVLDTLISDNAQIMVCDKNCILALAEERGLEGLSVIRNNVNTVGYSIAVRKGSDSLLRSINDGLFRIRMSGQYESILNRWIEEDQSVEIQKFIRNVAIAAGAISIIVAIYLFFNWRVRNLLKKKVKEMTAQLEENVQQMKSERDLRNQIIEHDPNMMILCDNNEQVILMNASARHTTGTKLEDTISLNLQEIPVIGKIIQLVKRQERLTQLDHIENTNVIYRGEAGNRRNYRCSITQTSLSELGMGFLIIISDVTKEENRKQELIEKEKTVAFSRLVAGIAHEIKNPLTGIQNFADLIKTEKDNPQFWQYFGEYVPIEISRISKLIEGLMNYARPVKGVKAVTELAPLVGESMYLMNTAIMSARIRLDVSVPDGLWFYVERDQIKQVLINIVLNSLEAVEKRKQMENDPDIEYSIAIGAEYSEGSIEIKIWDEGGGMSEEDLQCCMDPFYTTKQNGTGLGLAISRQFVQENGGTMIVDSTLGKGTVITMRFKGEQHE